MPDYTHDDAMRDLDALTFPYLMDAVLISERKQRLATYIADLESRCEPSGEADYPHQANCNGTPYSPNAPADDALAEAVDYFRKGHATIEDYTDTVLPEGRAALATITDALSRLTAENERYDALLAAAKNVADDYCTGECSQCDSPACCAYHNLRAAISDGEVGR